MWIKKMNISARLILMVTTFVSMCAVNGFAQEEDGKIPSVKAIGRAYPDSIVVRWGVDNPVAWQLGNKYGYLVERFTIMRDGERLNIPEKVRLFNEPQKPLPLSQWEPLAENDDYALIAAQAIYGESFELSENYSNDIMQVINKSRELEQRFSFALFSADISPKVARASGLWLTDHDVQQNEKYVYRVFANVPANIQPVDTAHVFVGIEDYQPLPKVRDVEAEFEDRKVLLSWNSLYFSDLFIAYKIERSEDGKNFQPITDLPITNTESPSRKMSRFMFKADSLPENYKKYYYRVRGLTAFGETGPPSDTVSGFGFRQIKTAPAITEADVIDNKEVKLKWEFDSVGNAPISRFKLLRAPQANGQYEEVKTNIAPGIREIIDEAPKTVNYYKIVVMDDYGQSRSSFPYLAQLIDSIPPISPVGLVGKIDTSGLVTVSWEANSEKDLYGYRVYRSNFKSEELQEVTVDPVSDTVFYDTLEIKTLTKTVYYKVRAVDFHYNPSSYSEFLKLEKPDLMPPTSPVFKKVTADNEGIQLIWANSSSDDVVNHLLFRRKAGDRGWKLIAVFNQEDADTTYVDKTAELQAYYDYTLLAVDESKLESEPATPVRSKRIDTGIRAAIDDVFAEVDRDNKVIKVAWQYNQPGIERFEVYRASEDEPLRIYQSLTGDSNQFNDSKLLVNTNYAYRIRAIYADGAKSPLSKIIEVKY